MNGRTFFAFVTGTVIGAAGAWVYFTHKYFGPVEEEQTNDDDFEYTEDETSNVEEQTDTDETVSESDRAEYHKIAKQYTEDPEDKSKKPYIIDEDDYGDGTVEYHVTWSYYEDGVVTDQEDHIVEDVDAAIGEDFVNHFGDTDTCYVRNEERHCDYEILRDGHTYYETPEEE